MDSSPSPYKWILEGPSTATSTASSSMTTVTFPPAAQVESGWHDHPTFILHEPTPAPKWIPVAPHPGTPLEILLGVTSTAAIVKWWMDRWRTGATVKVGGAQRI
jgi:hypothetical protein